MTGCSVKTLNSLLLASSVAERLARELDDGALQAEAQPEERDPVAARPADCADLALDAAIAEAAGHDEPGNAVELVGDLVRLDALQMLRSDPSHGDVDVVMQGGVLERLPDADVGVGQLGVLADDRDLDAPAAASWMRFTSSSHSARSGSPDGSSSSRVISLPRPARSSWIGTS